MTLTVPELIDVQDMIVAAFERRDFEKFLLEELGFDVTTELGAGGAYERMVFNVFHNLRTDERIAALIVKAAAKRPDHVALHALAVRASS